MTSSTKFYHVIQIILYICSCDQSFYEHFYERSYHNLKFIRIWSEKPLFLRGGLGSSSIIKDIHAFALHKYPQKNYSGFSSNLWESLMNFMVHIKMLWFFLSLNLSLPCKIKSIKLFSLGVEKELSISFNSFIRADLFAL